MSCQLLALYIFPTVLCAIFSVNIITFVSIIFNSKFSSLEQNSAADGMPCVKHQMSAKIGQL